MAPTWSELSPLEQAKICDQIERILRREGPRTTSGISQRIAVSHEMARQSLTELSRQSRVMATREDSGMVLWRASTAGGAA